MVTKAQKEEIVSRLKEKSEGATVAFVADFKDMNVEEITDLRRSLRSVGKCVVVKNTLAERALSGGKFENITKFLTGPSLLVLGREDAPKTIKTFLDFQTKVKPKLALKGGVIAGDESALDAASLEAIGSLPPKEVILAQIAGYLVSTPTQVVQSINQIIGGIGQLAVKVAEKTQK